MIQSDAAPAGPVGVSATATWAHRPLPGRGARLTGGLLHDWQRRNLAESLPLALRQLKAAGNLDNVRLAIQAGRRRCRRCRWPGPPSAIAGRCSWTPTSTRPWRPSAGSSARRRARRARRLRGAGHRPARAGAAPRRLPGLVLPGPPASRSTRAWRPATRCTAPGTSSRPRSRSAAAPATRGSSTWRHGSPTTWSGSSSARRGASTGIRSSRPRSSSSTGDRPRRLPAARQAVRRPAGPGLAGGRAWADDTCRPRAGPAVGDRGRARGARAVPGGGGGRRRRRDRDAALLKSSADRGPTWWPRRPT